MQKVSSPVRHEEVREYRAPKVTVYGGMVDLTCAGGSTGAEGGNKCNSGANAHFC